MFVPRGERRLGFGETEVVFFFFFMSFRDCISPTCPKLGINRSPNTGLISIPTNVRSPATRFLGERAKGP